MLTPLTDDDPRTIGPYRIANRIGAGGMGTVYLGFGPDGKAAAVKVPTPGLAHDAEFRSRFRLEVAAAQRVRGSRVAAVLAADVDADRPWMATEFVEGASLSDAVQAQGRFEPAMLTGLAKGLAEALATIHSAGVVHRDLKPSNVLLSWDGPKVIDFGIARAMDSTRHTRTGMIVGTMVWMAPEQLRGERAGTPADVFAWGACLAFAGTGRPPFRGERAEAVAIKIIQDEPDLAGMNDDIAPLVRATLAKDPAVRPTAAELVSRLTGVAGGTAVTTLLAGEGGARPPTGPHTGPRTGPHTGPRTSPPTGPEQAGTRVVGSGRRPYPPTTAPQPPEEHGRVTGRSRIPVVLAAVVLMLLAAAAVATALVASGDDSPGTDTNNRVPATATATDEPGGQATAEESAPPDTDDEPEPSDGASPDTGQSPTGTASPTRSPTSTPTTRTPSPTRSPTTPPPTTSPPTPEQTTAKPAPTGNSTQARGDAPGVSPR